MLTGDEVSAAAVRDAIHAILADPSPERAAARALAAEIAAMPAPPEVAAVLARTAFTRPVTGGFAH